MHIPSQFYLSGSTPLSPPLLFALSNLQQWRDGISYSAKPGSRRCYIRQRPCGNLFKRHDNFCNPYTTPPTNNQSSSPGTFIFVYLSKKFPKHLVQKSMFFFTCFLFPLNYCNNQILTHTTPPTSVADPDPDPVGSCLFGSPGSGSFIHKKTPVILIFSL